MRRQVITYAPPNATLLWEERTGKPTGLDHNRRPVFTPIEHSARLWLEQDSASVSEAFDEGPLSEFEDRAFVGRIYDPYDKSLYLQEVVQLRLDYTMGDDFSILFPARIIWAGAVAIPSPNIRMKQNMGEAISLIGKVRRKIQ
jgi:hypothetical protein